MAYVLLVRANIVNVGSNSLMPSTPVRFAFALVIGLVGPAVAQEPNVPPDASISLQRTSCFGPCPIYTVTIDARGTVTYDGERFVRVIGRRTGQIDTSIVAGLLATANRIRFFEMRDAYRVIENPDGTVGMVTDLPTKFVTVTVNGHTKKVEDYVAAPDSLAQFEREIDTAAGTKRWVFLDDDALEELARSGWLASSDEGAALLKQAIERDDVAIAPATPPVRPFKLDGRPARESGSEPERAADRQDRRQNALDEHVVQGRRSGRGFVEGGSAPRGYGRWTHCALVCSLCGQLARCDGASRGRSRSSRIDGNARG